jgi:hypothetical protein
VDEQAKPQFICLLQSNSIIMNSFLPLSVENWNQQQGLRTKFR